MPNGHNLIGGYMNRIVAALATAAIINRVGYELLEHLAVAIEHLADLTEEIAYRTIPHHREV